jgi:anion transporter
MSQIVFSIIIIIGMVVCFVTEIFPISVSALMGCMAFALSGIISYQSAFAGFSNDTVLMVAGAMVVGDAMFETGAAQYVGERIIKIVGYNEKRLIGVVVLGVGLLSAFCSNSATMAMFLPLIRSVSSMSGGKLKSKHIIMPMGLATMAGGCCTIVGSTPQLIAQSLLKDAGLRPFSFFELGIVGFPILFLMVVYFMTIGYRLICRYTEHLEQEYKVTEASQSVRLTPKIVISIAIMASMVIAMIAGIWTNGTVAIVAGIICIITGCIKANVAYSRMGWGSLIVIAATLGVGKGLTESGTALFVAEKIVWLLGGQPSVFLLLALVGILCTVLANLLSHTAALALVAPLFIPVASQLGIDATLLIFSVTCFINIGYSTPLGTASYQMTLSEGYKFNDYAKVGGLFNIIAYGVVLAICYSRFLI